MNNDVAAIGCLHHDTPDARVRPRFVAPVFGGDEPTAPRPQEKGFFDRLIKSRGERIDESNRAARDRHVEALAVWREDKRMFERQIAKRRNLIETLICEDVEAMEAYVEESLQAIMWPRETLISLEVTQGGLRAMLDVDLPELEDMPKQVAAVPARGMKLALKELSPTKVRRLYADHVHGIFFRLVREVFAALPKVQVVVASGYSQRRDPATAQLRDEYLLSAKVMRGDWESNDFQHMKVIDVIAGLERYDLRRDMSKSGSFKAIQPHET